MNTEPRKRGICACGCGKTHQSWSGFCRGHRPTINAYRHKDKQRLHRLRAERALGKPLPVGAIVHHADGSKSDESPLVICQDQAYHMLLHARMRIIKAGGNPDTEAMCSACQRPVSLESFWRRKSGKRIAICKPCSIAANSRYYHERAYGRTAWEPHPYA